MKNQTNTTKYRINTTKYSSNNNKTNNTKQFNFNKSNLDNKSNINKRIKILSRLVIPAFIFSLTPVLALAVSNSKTGSGIITEAILIKTEEEQLDVSANVNTVVEKIATTSTSDADLEDSSASTKDPSTKDSFSDLSEPVYVVDISELVVATDLSELVIEDETNSVMATSTEPINKPVDDSTSDSTNNSNDPDLSGTVSTSSSSSSSSSYPYAGLISLTNDERYYVYCVLAGEVGDSPYRDKLLVAQCFYDGLVYNKCSPRQLAKSQYDGYKDFNVYKQECIECGVTYYEDIIKAVNEVFDNFNMPTQDFVLFFHSGYSKWHQTASTIYLIEDTGYHKYYALKNVPEV
jgi:hypothetical protein